MIRSGYMPDTAELEAFAKQRDYLAIPEPSDFSFCDTKNSLGSVVVGGWLIHKWSSGAFCAIPIEAPANLIADVKWSHPVCVDVKWSHPVCDCFPYQESIQRCLVTSSWKSLMLHLGHLKPIAVYLSKDGQILAIS